jgi:hypothetical protein
LLSVDGGMASGTAAEIAAIRVGRVDGALGTTA